MNKEIEIITSGSYIDQGVKITTSVIRLSGGLMNEWLAANRQPDCLQYIDNQEGLQQAIAEMQDKQEAWQRKVQERMGISGQSDVFNKDGFTFGVWHNTSEIFTAVYMEPDVKSEHPKTIDDIIREYPDNVPVPVAAELLGKCQMFIRTGLQTGRLPFGSAVKTSSQWSYHIAPKALKSYVDGDRVLTTPEIIEQVVLRTLAAQEAGAS